MSLKAIGDTNNRGLIDLTNFNFDLKQHLLGDYLDKLAFPSDVRQKLREVFENHESYRKFVAPFDAVADLSFSCSWNKSATSCLRMFEALIYSSEMDGTKKTALKNRKTPE